MYPVVNNKVWHIYALQELVCNKKFSTIIRPGQRDCRTYVSLPARAHVKPRRVLCPGFAELTNTLLSLDILTILTEAANIFNLFWMSPKHFWRKTIWKNRTPGRGKEEFLVDAHETGRRPAVGEPERKWNCLSPREPDVTTRQPPVRDLFIEQWTRSDTEVRRA